MKSNPFYKSYIMLQQQVLICEDISFILEWNQNSLEYRELMFKIFWTIMRCISFINLFTNWRLWNLFLYHLVQSVLADGPQWYAHELKHDNLAFQYILTVIDIFSKYAWAKCLKSKHAKSVIKPLKEILNNQPTPRIIQSDNGLKFKNA